MTQLHDSAAVHDYPVFSLVNEHMKDELFPVLNNICAGISEFTFPSLLLHKSKYGYRIAKLNHADQTDSPDNYRHDESQPPVYVLSGSYDKKPFFSIMGGIPRIEDVITLFNDESLSHNGLKPYWKNMSQTQYDALAEPLTVLGYTAQHDRGNSDYLYLRSDLALLPGKNFHKKKNLVNAFSAAFTVEVKILDSSTRLDAVEVLETWHDAWLEAHPGENSTDYCQSMRALDMIEKGYLYGWIVYADGVPAGWSLGEYINGNTTFCIHFEKGIPNYKGIYQFVNKAAAERLDDTVLFINREQDLGDEGLRQAKLTYRPHSFINKYFVLNKT